MKRLIVGLTLLGAMSSFASEITLDEFIHSNDLKVCKKESIGKAEFLSFEKEVSKANAGLTTFYLSDEIEYINPKYVKPSFLECMFLGDECKKLRRVRDIDMPSNFENVVYEIIQDNSETKGSVMVTGNALGYGHGSSVKSKVTHLDIDISAVAGEISELASKLTRLTEEFLGDSRNSRVEFSKRYNAIFYCRK